MEELIKIGYGLLAGIITCFIIEQMVKGDSLDTIRKRYEKPEPTPEKEEYKTPETSPTAASRAAFIVGCFVCIFSLMILLTFPFNNLLTNNTEYNQTISISDPFLLKPIMSMFSIPFFVVCILVVVFFVIPRGEDGDEVSR